MSTVITKATLERNLPYFLVHVLRNELTDTHSPARPDKDWIRKSQPVDHITPDDLPKITLDISPMSYENWSIDGTKYKSDDMMIECWVMTGGANTTLGALADRDAFTDTIREAMFDPTSADSDGLTLVGNHIVLRSLRTNVGDFYHPKHPKIIRAKRISMTFKYYGG